MIGLTFWNLERFYDAIACATEVLNREKGNKKALFRRIKARIGTWDLHLVGFTYMCIITKRFYK